MFKGLKSSAISAIVLLSYSILVFPIMSNFMLNKYSILFEWEIFQMSSSSMSFIIILDPVSPSFKNTVCLISGCVMMFSSSYMSHDFFLKRFVWLACFLFYQWIY